MGIEDYKVYLRDLGRQCQAEEVAEGLLEMPIDLVGQERVLRALNFVLSPGNKFHIVVPVTETKHLPMVLENYIRQIMKERKQNGETFPLEDYCYVHNFGDSEKPYSIIFPAGQGSPFRSRVKKIKEDLKKQIPVALSAKDTKEEKRKLVEELQEEEKEEVEQFYGKLKDEGLIDKWKARGWEVGVQIANGVTEFYWGPIDATGKTITGKKNLDMFWAVMDAKTKDKYDKDWQELDKEVITKIAAFTKKLQVKYIRKLADEFQKIEDKASEEIINLIFGGPLRKYAAQPKVKRFLEGLKEYTTENKDLFMPQPTQTVNLMTAQGQQMQGEMPVETEKMKERKEKKEDPYAPYEINLLVDNKDTEGPPILIKSHPTYAELFGSIERRISAGGLDVVTDHTLIRPGAFHQANGGFIILDLNDILATKQVVYHGLKRILRENKIEIKDSSNEYGSSVIGKNIFPETIPLKLKVIVLIRPHLYSLLWHYPYDKELVDCFKITAHFDEKIAYTPEALKGYSGFIDKYCQEKPLLPCAAKAKARIVDCLLREAESKEKLAWDIEKLKTILKEANFYAQEEKSEAIEERHIKRAIEEKIYRSNLLEEELQKQIEKDIIKVDTDGEEVGQINALAVLMLGGYKFGKPLRVTVTTYRGGRGLVNLERVANLSDETHTMGIETLIGFFNARYGKDKNLNFEGRIRFEQIYGLAGPSASAGELFALISSLADIPIKQSLAITGTVDQKGNIGVIGGINQKIEGFFKTCEAKGLTGKQGVVIPKTNVANLMLTEEVVDAVKRGIFHIYAIETVEQGIEILMDHSFKDIDKAVNKTFEKWSKGKRFF